MGTVFVRPPSSRFLDIGEYGGHLVFSMEACLNRHLGLGLRWPEARRKVRLRLKSIGAAATAPAGMVFTVSCSSTSLPAITAVLDDIDRDLDFLAERPLAAHLVERALDITARERLRWTKDGRLPTAGTSKIQRGQPVSLNLYPIDSVEQLIREPQRIRAWREADAQSGGVRTERVRS
jgi:hypothetical protein